ncbi:hypothetical protein [Mesonia sp. K7]|uniref:hypothetical protein n=1 Tax=Mesonia sp. K7 TaxID=2218606 RepID=UPI000DA79A32|nr:hypothetical protein [Mesonia sp. K7]PZD79661.1 hypothetical protein DNG35_01250 [Mesonia sp. K7]
MFKENVAKLTGLVDKYIKEKDSETLKVVEKQIESLLCDLIIEDENLFIPIILEKLLKPLRSHVLEINKKYLSGRSRYKNRVDEKSRITNSFMKSVLNVYQRQMKNYDFCLDSKYVEHKNTIIKPYPENFPIEFISEDSFKNILNALAKAELKYYKEKLETLEMDKFNAKIFLSVNDIKDKIQELNNDIFETAPKVNKLEKKANQEEDYIDSWFLENQILIHLNTHKNALEELLSQLRASFYVLKSLEESESIPVNVFGHKDYESFEDFYEEMEFFLGEYVTMDELINVFILNNNKPQKRINLVNGTLNDYAYLMRKLKSLFAIKSGDYSQWWADRFLFNGVEKNKKAISTMMSNEENDLARKSSKRTKINQIVKTIQGFHQ